MTSRHSCAGLHTSVTISVFRESYAMKDRHHKRTMKTFKKNNT